MHPAVSASVSASVCASTCAFVSASLLDALAIVFPITCAGCGLDDRALCISCRAALLASPLVHQLSDGTTVHSALRYEGAVRKMVLSLKEQGRTDIARALALPLRTAVHAGATTSRRSSTSTPADHGSNSVELVAVPGSRVGYRRRGYDPVRLLMRHAGLPAPARVLANSGDRAAQKTLDSGERAANLVGTMRATVSLAHRRFLVVDDVLTTGATLVEATRALHAADAEVLGASTLAFTPRYFPPAR